MLAASAVLLSGSQGENKIGIIDQVIVDFALIFFPIIFLIWQKKEPLKELGLYFTKPKNDIINSIILLVVLIALSFLIAFFASFFIVNDIEKIYAQVQSIKESSPFFLAYLLVVRVIAEEIFFRGFLVKQTGAFFSTAVFSLAHVFYGSIMEVIGVFVLGFVLAKAFERNKTLIPNIVAHFLYNLINVLAL